MVELSVESYSTVFTARLIKAAYPQNTTLMSGEITSQVSISVNQYQSRLEIPTGIANASGQF